MCIISELIPLSPQRNCLSIYYNVTVDENLCETWPYFGTTPLLLVKVKFLMKSDSGYPKMNFLCINSILLSMCINLRVWKIRQLEALPCTQLRESQGEKEKEKRRIHALAALEKESMHGCAYVCIHICMHVCMHAWMHVSTKYMNVLFVCMYVLTCVNGQVNSTPLRSCQSFISMTPWLPKLLPILAARSTTALENNCMCK